MSTQTQASQKKNPNRIRLRADDRAMAILCYGIVGLFSFLCLVPFWYVLVYSFEPYSLYLTRPELPWPMEITLDAYKKALAYPLIWSGYRNTLFLATGQVHAALTELGLIAVRQLFHKRVGLRDGGGVPKLLHRRVSSPQRRFSSIVPVNSTLSCSATPIAPRSVFR